MFMAFPAPKILPLFCIWKNHALASLTDSMARKHLKQISSILKIDHSLTFQTTYNTRCSQSVANFLNVPKFQPTIHKFTKQFGFSFAFDAPTVWNSLPEDIRASPTIASFRKKLKTYLYAKAYPP